MNPFNCIKYRPKLHQNFHNFVVTFRKCIERFLEKANKKLKFIKQNFKKFRNWHHVRLPMQSKLTAYSGLQKVMHLQLFNVTFVKDIERQPQRALALVDDTRTTSAGVAIRPWVKMDVH